MKKITLIIIVSLSILVGNQTFAQTKKVLLEVFSGAKCGNCPKGTFTLDSLLNIYPNLIGVSLHSYENPDSMFFEEIDTIGLALAPDAPLGAINRIYWYSWDYVAEPMTNWGNRVECEFKQEVDAKVSVSSVWNPINREISATISTEILWDLPTGDYRFSLYIVEDSVTGVGDGYDQINNYNNMVGNPFYGLGNPIVGHVHKNVVRAILPQAWGQAGIIPSNPLTGQNFSTTINYILPIEFNENKIKLVAFVNKKSVNHITDKVLNVEEIPLIQSATGIKVPEKMNTLCVFPNPVTNELNLEIKGNSDKLNYEIVNVLGQVVYKGRIVEKAIVQTNSFEKGIYIVKIQSENNFELIKIIKE